MHRKGVVAAAVLSAALVVGGCTTERPTVSLSAVPGGTGGGTGTPAPVTPPVETVTVTAVETRTVVATTTVVTTVTVRPTGTATAAAPAPTTPAAFDRAAALTTYANLVDDLRLLDRMSLAGNAAALQLDLLAQHLEALAANGAPPGVDAPSYYGRVASLALFARAASDEAAAGSPVAQRRYVVVRRETGVLLTLVNGALGTTFTVPAAPPSPTPTPSTPSPTSATRAPR